MSTSPVSMLVEKSAELRPVGLGTDRHFAEHFFGSGGGQRRKLRVDALAVRRYPCMAVDHAAILHSIICTRKGAGFQRLGFRSHARCQKDVTLS